MCRAESIGAGLRRRSLTVPQPDEIHPSLFLNSKNYRFFESTVAKNMTLRKDGKVQISMLRSEAAMREFSHVH
jgi:hypothetical protein